MHERTVLEIRELVPFSFFLYEDPEKVGLRLLNLHLAFRVVLVQQSPWEPTLLVKASDCHRWGVEGMFVPVHARDAVGTNLCREYEAPVGQVHERFGLIQKEVPVGCACCQSQAQMFRGKLDTNNCLALRGLLT